jgi:hypothetical protein
MKARELNRLSRDIFSYKSLSENDNIKIKVNSNTISRDELISMGRLATCEFFGKEANNDKNNIEKYITKLNNIDYSTFSHKTWEKTVLFCAAQANKMKGKAPYTTMAEVAQDRSLARSEIFLATLAAIAEEVIYPLLPAVMDSITDRLISWERGRLGETKLIDIQSNDFFVFDDDSWGSVSSKPYQYLYKSQIAITPKAYTAKCKIKWYQDVIDGEAGRFYAAFARGAASKMYAITLEKFKAAVGNTKYLPSEFIYDSFSQDNWNKALMTMQAVNGVSRNQLFAIGTLAGLSQIVPTIGTSGEIAGLQGEIGTEFARNGFLANVAGVDLIEASLAVVPGTQNYNPQYISLDDPTQENVYIMAKIGYAPMVGVIADGSPIDIVFTPTETADMTINISETIIFDLAPAFSSKIVKMQV